MTTPVAPPEAGERTATPDIDLAFAEPDSVDSLRSFHHARVEGYRNYKVALLGENPDQDAIDEANRQADAEIDADLDDEFSAHIARGTRQMSDDLSNRLSGLLPQFSYNHMSDEEWNNGLEDANGVRQPSGRERLQAELDRIRAELNGTPPPPGGPDNPDGGTPPPPGITPELTTEREQAQAELDDAREALAKLSIKGRQKIRGHGKKAERLQAQYREAEQRYHRAKLRHGAVQAMVERAQGVGEDQIYANVIVGIDNEHDRFNEEEIRAMNDGSRRMRFVRWFAKDKRLFTTNLVSGVALGAGTKAVIGGVAGFVAAPVAPIALGAGLAIGSTRAILAANIGNAANLYRTIDERFDVDNRELNRRLENLQGADRMARIHEAHGHLLSIIRNRVEIDRKTNAKRVRKAIYFSAAGALLGAGLEYLGHTVYEDVFGHYQAPHPTQHPHPHPKAHPHPRPAKPSQPGTYEGYQTHISVPQGGGYEQALTSLAAEKGITLSGPQSWDLYTHLNGIYHGHFFENIGSYNIHTPGHYGANTNWGIDSPGNAQWDPNVINSANEWFKQHGLEGAGASVAKKVGKSVGKKAVTLV